MKLGQFLIQRNLATKEQIEEALKLQSESGGQLGDILFAVNSIRSLDYYKTLAQHYGMACYDLVKNPVDSNLLTQENYDLYLEKMCLPVKNNIIATSNPSVETIDFIYQHWGEDVHIVCTPKFDILWTLQKRFSDNHLDHAINLLMNNNVAFSAKKTFSLWQKILLIAFAIFSVIYAYFNPIKFFIITNIILTFTLSFILLYKICLALIASFIKHKVTRVDASDIPLHDLPVYSILIPLYKEKESVLKNLFKHIHQIQYPKHKLDVKVLVEQDDSDTIEILKSLNLPSYCEFIYIPAGNPRTKAKACNYGLKFARGEYLTLYDAEDKPDPFQLKIALATFLKNKDSNLVCLQGRLNFYNTHENWLTKMFGIEYTYWFDLLLPALEYLKTPIPLGGTSNHFKTSVLKEIDAWDPYNVAEDADIGIRLERLGYTAKVIPSTTYEEANCQLINWLKQRTRWIKGYMQTFIVHMRNPIKLWYAIGTPGFIGFSLFVGGTIISNLSNLILWVIFFVLLLPSPWQIGYLFPDSIIYLAWFNFLVGTLGVVFLNLLGIIRRKKYDLILPAITAPVYWLLMSLASYRALYQLIFNPSYWDKTEHGISKIHLEE